MSFSKVDYKPNQGPNSSQPSDLLGPDSLKTLAAVFERRAGNPTEDVVSALAIAQNPIPWIFPDFIVDGDQVMIAGAAKSGKSWMALQLSMAAATGGQFLNWRAVKPVKTLYVNLEVGQHMWSRRVVKALGGNRATYNKVFGQGVDVPLFWSRSDLRTIDAMDSESQRQFAHWVKEEGFEFVVFDVLARCHNCDENLNGEMQRVLLNLRLWAPGCTTVVVHHARKPPAGSEHVNLGPASVRGASAIVGEVDLAMILAVRAGQGARYSLTFAARNVEMPDELLIDRDDETMQYGEYKGEENNLDQIIQTLFQSGHSLPRKDVQQAVADGMGVAFETARKAIKGALERGLIAESRQGRSYFYYLPQESPVLRAVPGPDYYAASRGE